jgi:hypothetical protein
MTKQSFLESLAWQLTLRGVRHTYADVEAFVDDVWSVAEDDPDVSRWAHEYAISRAPGIGRLEFGIVELSDGTEVELHGVVMPRLTVHGSGDAKPPVQ